MDLTLSPEQEAIRDAIRGVLMERSPLTRVRAVVAAEPGIDPDLWRVAGELSWLGLAAPEAAGGAGYGLPEAMLLFFELGRTLAPGPWLGTVLAAELGAPDAAAEVLAGRCRVAVIDDPADRLGAGVRLEGEARHVSDAGAADALLVLGARAVRWCPARAAGVAVDPAPSLDPTRRLARVTFAGAAAVGLDADAARLRLAATVLVAAEAVGVAERALELSVEYGKVRQQFGRPIGSFQAIKHRCADMAVRAEAARSLTVYAAVAVRDGEPDAAVAVHGAKALAGRAALANATDNVQNHGGMGYTWEADAHLYLKRAHLLEQTFGPRAAHLDALAAPWRAA
ncbi:MAG TPA: acyl-CoA dehydrogenase family protein [Candidatus Binatia bacterium]|nr:acyl-CoA dehydrogenase family protein [Candidatus Binatia bacterium]